ncbi:MAG: apolipoprotein N-acyltransferase [Thermodesulfobacteriota bacterium]
MKTTPRDITATLLSAVMLTLAFPPYDFEFIAWVAFLPVLLVLVNKKGFSPALTGFIWGIAFFSGTVYWVSHSAAVYGNLSWPLSIAITLLLTSFLALYTAVFFQAASYLIKAGGMYLLFGIPCLWVFIELIRARLFTGFPWVSLGYSQSLFIPLIQIADITGIYGISFLIVMVNSLLLKWFLALKAGKNQRPPKGMMSAETIIVISLVGISLLYGSYREKTVKMEMKGWRSLNVGIVQGNINQALKWDPAYQEQTMRIYRDLSLEGFKQEDRMALLVWPESATPFYLQSDREYLPQIYDTLKELSVYLLTGTPAYEYTEDGTPLYYNSAFLLSPEGKETGRYNKVHLVPFGEYVPMRRFLPFVNKIVEGIGGFSSGKELINLSIPDAEFGVLICYEAIFPELVRQFVEKGADFMVNITNDAWFGKTAAPFQHLSQTVVRSVENRVYLVRAANTGISAIVDPTGRIIVESDLFTRETLKGEIRLKRKGFKTFYTIYGDVFAWMCVVTSIVFLLLARTKLQM